jgi:hypothetical protein
MRIIDEDVLLASFELGKPAPPSPALGGAARAEAEFGACAERWGMTEVNYSFEGQGHRTLERQREWW